MTSKRTRSLAAADQAFVWHPFTQMNDWLSDDPLIIDAADGFDLIDTEGRRYLDGVSSLWVSVHGHRVPEIDDAIRAQLDRVAHSTLLGLGGAPSIELAERLVALAPPGITKVFFSEAGAAAVEVGLKMAFGYWQHRGVTTKRTFLALEEAYHGDTLGAVSVGGMQMFHDAYRPLLFDVFRVPSPYVSDEASLARAEEILRDHAAEICAFVLEPLVQGAAGMLTAQPGYLRKVRELCDRYDVLLICDEVATGIGRTGTFFACEQEDVSPDILVCGKGLSGGYLPIAATMTTQAVFDAFLAPYDAFKTFFHGHTYTGNALACAAAIANLDLMAARSTVDGVREREAVLAKMLEPLEGNPHVYEIRQRGLMVGIDLRASGETFYDTAERVGHRVILEARKRGVIIRPLSDVIVLMPPLAIPIDELQRLARVTIESIDAVTA